MKHYRFENAAVRLAGLDAAREFLEPMFIARDRELLVVALCDDGLRLTEMLGFPGTEDFAQASVAEIIGAALRSKSAGLILAHNHPSNDQRPSAADLALTRKLSLVAEALDMTLLDHLIFDSGPVFSFRRQGLL